MILGEDPNAHLVALARRLTEQTRARRITWTRQADGGRFLYAATSGSVSIERSRGGNRLVMRVRDANGVPVDEIETSDRRGTVASTVAHLALLELYDAVSDSSHAVVNDLMRELG